MVHCQRQSRGLKCTTSHARYHKSQITRHISHVTYHTSHITHHTLHITKHTSHTTSHTSQVTPATQVTLHHSSMSALDRFAPALMPRIQSVVPMLSRHAAGYWRGRSHVLCRQAKWWGKSRCQKEAAAQAPTPMSSLTIVNVSLQS